MVAQVWHDRDGDDDDTPVGYCICGCGATFRPVGLGRRKYELVGECLRDLRRRHLDWPGLTVADDRPEPIAIRAPNPTSRRAKMLAVLREVDVITPPELAARLGWSRRDAMDALKGSARFGEVERVARGVYRLAGVR